MSPNFCNPIRKVVDELLVTSTTASKNEKPPRDKSPKKRARGSKKGGRGRFASRDPSGGSRDRALIGNI